MKKPAKKAPKQVKKQKPNYQRLLGYDPCSQRSIVKELNKFI